MSTLNLDGSPYPGNGFASAIAIVGTDVYIAGASTLSAGGYKSAYWKNAVPTNLSDNTFRSING